MTFEPISDQLLHTLEHNFQHSLHLSSGLSDLPTLLFPQRTAFFRLRPVPKPTSISQLVDPIEEQCAQNGGLTLAIRLTSIVSYIISSTFR